MYQIKTLKPYNILYSNTTATKIGSLPANSLITQIRVLVGTAFTAGSTDYLDIGTSTSSNRYANDIDLSSTGSATVTLTNVGAVESTSAPTDVYCTYVPSGSSPTSGSAYIVIEYVQL